MMASTTRRPRGGGRGKRAPVRPTQKDIAAAAGVSQAAVSLVLNKAETPSVPAATRERILKLAGELGYQPNHPARMFRSARTMALDPKTHRIYLATAQFGEPEPGQRRGKMVADSFKILVYEMHE